MLDLSLKIAFIYNILEMFHEQTRDSHANKKMREKSWFRSIRNSFISELNRQTWQLKRSSVKWNNPDNRHCVSFFFRAWDVSWRWKSIFVTDSRKCIEIYYSQFSADAPFICVITLMVFRVMKAQTFQTATNITRAKTQEHTW